MAYLHGAKQTRVESLVAGINSLPNQIIGLVGVGSTDKNYNTPTLLTSITQARTAYGKDVGGTTLMSALETIYAMNATARVVVVNVLSTAKVASVIDGTGKAKKVGTGASAVWCTGIHAQTIPTTTGYVDLAADVLAGLEKLKTAEGVIGDKIRVIIAPGYSQITSVRDKIQSVATELEAVGVSDVFASSAATAITARVSGAYGGGSKRLIYCFPNMMRTNTSENEEQVASYSQYVATALASRIGEDSYGYTPSSFDLLGVVKPVVAISCSLSNDAADSNLLNAKGIVTYFKSSVTGYRVWGNWLSSYPASAKPEDMIGVARTWDAFEQLINDTILSYQDKTITNGMIDFIEATCRNKISYLKGKGLLVAGESFLDREKTTPQEIAQGKLYFKHILTFATSLDTIEFTSVSDITGYNVLIK